MFKAASVGGKSAIAGEVASFTRNRHLGRPIVTLSSGSYKNKKYGGHTQFPTFVNVGYDAPPAPAGPSPNSGNGDGARVIGASKTAVRNADMDDEIPF
jgi:hypothetical protein